MRPPVFLTGATGFLGMEVLARLLEQGDREVITLVRASDDVAARERIDGVLTQLWRDPTPYRDRVRAVAGDVTSDGLGISSARHNAVMAEGCGLSHQCPGEPSLGQRETNAGVQWTAAGENIGEGGPVADSSSAIAQMATRITQSMLDEQPPSDGHRENILSRTFRFIGITVTRDSHGTVWMTQDFSN